MIKNYNQYLKENNDYSDIDPYGEEIWDEEEESNPILYIARKQGKPYDQITYLDCYGKNLDNLDGVENLVNLENLDCSYNNLTNLNGIENLTNLLELNCYNNNLTNLNEMKNLINLKRLYCHDNHLTSLNEIENFNLEYLHCWNNNFSNEYKEYLIDYCKKKKIKYAI